MEDDTSCGVHVVSRHMVRPLPPPPTTTTMVNGNNGCHTPTVNGNGCHRPKAEVEVIHLTPSDLRLISVDYIQKGILLPKPPSMGDNDLVNALQSSFACALRLFYPFAGRLASEEHGDGTVSVFLLCTGEGAEFVHAVAPEVAVADIISKLYTPPVVWDLYPLPFVLGADAAIERLPVLAVQVTVLADGIFIGMTLNHSVGDGTAFWHFFNTWSEINRAGGGVGIVSANLLGDLSTPPSVFKRWFLETCPVPIPMPFSKLEDIVRRFERTTVKECVFTFSAASVKKLKARANDEMAGSATTTISSLQAVLAHFWRAVCRARRLTPEQSTFYSVVVGCRGRVNGIPPGYVGNALVIGKAEATSGEIEEKGQGWTAWLLNRAVASFDEVTMRESLERWVWQPDFTYMDNLSYACTALITGSSPRFDVFGNDFGWGKPLAVRSGSGNKADGKATVFEGPERGGSISLEVCIAPDALERLVADQAFVDAAMPAAMYTTDDKAKTHIQVRCYTAASVPPEKVIIGPTVTGLGVFVQLTNSRGKDYRRLHFKGHVCDAADIQIAYKHAMQLAINICTCLNFENVIFLENQFHATAQGVVKTRKSAVNKAAHKLAKQARQSLPQECSFSCESHHDLCPVIKTLRNLQWGDYALISVRCF